MLEEVHDEGLLGKKINDIGTNSSASKSENKNKELKEKKKLMAIYFLSGLVVVSIILFIIVLKTSKNQIMGEFECIYYCTGEETSILNSDYERNDLEIKINTDIYNDDDENPTYNKKGDFNVLIKVFGSELDMNNMFSSTNIKRIKMTSKQKLKITDLESSFENCTFLEKFEIQGFDTSEVESMSKLFNNAKNLKEVNIESLNTSNLMDMSYMFANTNISSINIHNFPLEILINSTGVFENCKTNVTIKNEENINEKDIIVQLKEKYPNSSFSQEKK